MLVDVRQPVRMSLRRIVTGFAAAHRSLELRRDVVLGALAARNIPQIDVLPVQGINVADILRRNRLVLTKAAVEALEARFA